jgi:hypothetical protein
MKLRLTSLRRRVSNSAAEAQQLSKIAQGPFR